MYFNEGTLVTSLLSDGLIINVNVALSFLPFFCPSPLTNGPAWRTNRQSKRKRAISKSTR